MANRGLSVPTEKVETTTPDGVSLVATFVPASKLRAPLAVLLHQLGRDRSTFEPLFAPLREAGFAQLALDFRGHGESTVSRAGALNWENFSESEWRGILTDVAAVLALAPKLRGVDASSVALVGASIGANAALMVGGSTEVVKRIVLISPGLNYRGLETAETAPKLAGKPTLIVSAANDEYAHESAREIAKLVPEGKLEVLEGEKHGTDLFADGPKLTSAIVRHLAPLASKS